MALVAEISIDYDSSLDCEAKSLGAGRASSPVIGPTTHTVLIAVH